MSYTSSSLLSKCLFLSHFGTFSPRPTKSSFLSSLCFASLSLIFTCSSFKLSLQILPVCVYVCERARERKRERERGGGREHKLNCTHIIERYASIPFLGIGSRSIGSFCYIQDWFSFRQLFKNVQILLLLCCNISHYCGKLLKEI